MNERPTAFAVFIGLLGVILPAVSVGVEATTHMCAETFFDPIPTIWHTLAAGFVPLANLYALVAIWRDDARHVRVIAVANAVAMGIALFYSIVFLPLVPLGIIAIVYMLLGLLPLTPLIAFATTIFLRLRLSRLGDASHMRVPRVWPLAACALALLVLADAQAATTRYFMLGAVSDSEARRVDSLRWLRSFGDGDTMLRMCYVRGGRNGSFLSLVLTGGKTVDTDQAREVYYRVEGVPFTSVPAPEFLGPRWLDGGREFDEDQGGQDVGGALKGLSLASSHVDGSLDADAATGYLEWTLVFRNTSDVQREARAQVELPPGAVVSRLTLWIDGEEREAAFGGRGQVREAYEKVVRVRRDPVLVTTSGPDRVLVQCFPVPPNGGEMKARIGITAPLALERGATARLSLPRFLDRNFAVEGLAHEVWIEAKTPLEGAAGAFAAEQPSPVVFAVRGAPTDEQLSGPAGLIVARRAAAPVEAVSSDPGGAPGALVRQTLVERGPAAPSRVVLMLDGSRPMRAHAAEVVAALDALPDGLSVGAVVAGDLPVVIAEPSPLSPESRRDIADRVASFPFEGGRDGAAALGRAWDLAASSPQSAVVWVHGSQPLLLPGADLLRHRFDRRPGAVTLYEAQVEPGPNRLVERLDGVPDLRAVPRAGTTAESLRRLFSNWTPDAREIVAIRERVAAGAPRPVGAKETSDHLARLWARDEVSRLLATGVQADEDAAAKLASAYRLVTPVTGAVVLETAAQFRDAGLEPGDPAQVPTIPEPEVWLLAAVALAALAYTLRRRRAACEPV